MKSMSIINPDKDINIQLPEFSSKPPIISQLTKHPHINSRNAKRGNLSPASSQFSTKEGTPNKEEANIANRTIEARNMSKEFEQLSTTSSKDKLSNITEILNQNNYNYANVRHKIPNSESSNDHFVYNMLYKTTTIRTEKIKERLNDIKVPSVNPVVNSVKNDEKDKDKDNGSNSNSNSKGSSGNVINRRDSKKMDGKGNHGNHHQHKEKITCCFFFK